MDREMELLFSVLRSIDYPTLPQVIDKYSHCVTEDISVEDFLRIVAGIGNFISLSILRRPRLTFPEIYLEGRRIYPKDREMCCEMIGWLTKHLGFSLKFTKTEINSPHGDYKEKRARFLKLMCVYWQQIFGVTPPSTPEKSETPTPTTPHLRRVNFNLPGSSTV